MVYTADKEQAGTDANVYIWLIGPKVCVSVLFRDNKLTSGCRVIVASKRWILLEIILSVAKWTPFSLTVLMLVCFQHTETRAKDI